MNRLATKFDGDASGATYAHLYSSVVPVVALSLGHKVKNKTLRFAGFSPAVHYNPVRTTDLEVTDRCNDGRCKPWRS